MKRILEGSLEENCITKFQMLLSVSRVPILKIVKTMSDLLCSIFFKKTIFLLSRAACERKVFKIEDGIDIRKARKERESSSV